MQNLSVNGKILKETQWFEKNYLKMQENAMENQDHPPFDSVLRRNKFILYLFRIDFYILNQKIIKIC